MRTIDFSPLFRHSVGFDRMQRMLDAATRMDSSANTYPPYNIEQVGEDNYCLVRIPPGVYNGYKTYGVKPAIIANCATEPHDPSEMKRLDPFDPSIPYDWELVHR